MAFKREFYVNLDHILALMPGYVYWLDCNNVYQGCNDLFAKFLNLGSRLNIIGKKNVDLLWSNEKEEKEYIEIVDKNNLEVLKNGINKTFEEQVIFNGIRKIFLSNKTPLYDTEKNIMGLLSISFDISERMAHESKFIIESRQMKIALDNIMKHLPAHVYWKDKIGIYLGCNDKQAKSLGLKYGSEVIGKTDYELPWKKEDAENFRKNDLEVITTGMEKIVEENAIVDSKQTVVLTQKIPLRDESDRVVGVLGISIDVGELKKAQKKNEQISRSKIEFISIATHEIRNPVSNVKSLLDLMHDSHITLNKIVSDNIKDPKIIPLLQKAFEENKDFLLTIGKQVDKTLKSVTDLGELAQLQVYGTQVNYNRVNLHHLMEQVLKALNTQEKNITINLDIASTFPDLIEIDYQNILKVLEIIVGNALRFSPANGIIRITITEAANKKEPSHILIAVNDQGPGISQNQLMYIFATATGDDNPESRYRKPSLQIPQAKMLIEASGGYITIQSKFQQGTTVLLNFPYYPVQQENSNSESLSLLAQEREEGVMNIEELSFTEVLPLLKTWRFLLVEDNYETQQHICRLFKAFDLNLDMASTGQAAIELINQYYYDLAFLDISLDDMTGLDVFRHLQKIHAHALAVAITSYHSDKDISFFLEQGIMTILPKPVTREELQECLKVAYQVINDDK